MLDPFYSQHLKLYQAASIRGEDNPTILVGHRIFRWIAFRPSHDVQHPIRSFSVSQDAHLLHEDAWDDERIGELWGGPPLYHNPLGPDGDVGDENAREYIARHPLVARSFACFFPVDDISFCWVHDIELDDHQWEPDVERPVTVLDVLRILHLKCVCVLLHVLFTDCSFCLHSLEYELQLQDMRRYVSSHEKCLEEKGWGLSDSLDNVRTIRDTFSAWWVSSCHRRSRSC